MFSSAVSLRVTINGVLAAQNSTLEYNSQELISVDVPAAKSGTLTTRTDNDTGTLTMSSGHGFTDGQKLDVFWSGGSRRNMTIGTVVTNSVPIDGGSGDNLPTAATAITAMVPTQVVAEIDGDEVVALTVSCPTSVNGWVVFCQSDADPISAAAYQLPPGTVNAAWATGLGITNPLAAEAVGLVKFSHGSTVEQTMTASVAFN